MAIDLGATAVLRATLLNREARIAHLMSIIIARFYENGVVKE
jgi:hypothetical protein